MQMWYHDNETSDPRLPHHYEHPPWAPTPRIEPHLLFPHPYYLAPLGILTLHHPPHLPNPQSPVIRLVRSRKYAKVDEITVSPSALGASYAKNCAEFYTEHMHEDEEIRWVLEGRGYWDVRDKEDKWVRILAVPGDLIVLPAGIYHRFTVDESQHCRAKRFYAAAPKWAALPRSEETEQNEVRREYVRKLAEGFGKEGDGKGDGDGKGRGKAEGEAGSSGDIVG